MGRLLKNKNYTFSVLAQFCYVGTQISVWTYTNFYIPEALGTTQEVALAWHTGALVLFAGIRERIILARVPKPLQDTAIGLVGAGMMSLAFFGFKGMV